MSSRETIETEVGDIWTRMWTDEDIPYQVVYRQYYIMARPKIWTDLSLIPNIGKDSGEQGKDDSENERIWKIASVKKSNNVSVSDQLIL